MTLIQPDGEARLLISFLEKDLIDLFNKKGVSMAWTQPKTWTNEPLVAGDMNTHLRDNLEELKEPPQGGTEIDNASNYSTTSTVFVDVDATDFSTTINTNGGDVLVTLCATVVGSSNWAYFDIDVDGSRVGDDDGIIKKHNSGGSGDAVMLYFWVKGLAAGSHTFTLQWKANSGTVYLYGGQSGAGNDVHGQWDVREVS